MHGVYHSRGRIFFEVLCALAVSASLAGAWMQTGASALLAAAGVAATYGLVHMFDLRRPKSAAVVEPQRIDFAADDQVDLVADEKASVPLAAADQPLEADSPVEELVLVEPAAPPAKAPRKSRARRSSAKGPKVTELAPPEEPKVAEPAQPEEVHVAELSPPEEVDAEFAVPEEAAHSHIAPLFEPEPFVRMPRAFGRRGRI